MEDLLLGAGKYVAGALGVMVFMFILDVLCSSRAEQEQDSEDAKGGILRGKEAGRFVAVAEKSVRDAKVRADLREANHLREETSRIFSSFYTPTPLPSTFDEEPEELSPYQAGQAAYCLGREAEDNPFRDDAYLGSEWEAGYYNSMKGDMGTWE